MTVALAVVAFVAAVAALTFLSTTIHRFNTGRLK